jgi:hypothetical protein
MQILYSFRYDGKTLFKGKQKISKKSAVDGYKVLSQNSLGDTEKPHGRDSKQTLQNKRYQ